MPAWPRSSAAPPSTTSCRSAGPTSGPPTRSRPCGPPPSPSIGRAVAFSLAAFRQAFAGGKDLSDVDNVLIAAAACELHPNAVLKAIETQSVKDKLREATKEAYDRGVRGVPTIAVGDQLFYGDDHLEEAASALAEA